MVSTQVSRRIAAIGASAIVGVGGAAIVGTASPAQAASVETQYTCTTLNGPATSDVTVKLSLPKNAKAGSNLKARPFKMRIALPAELVDTLRFFGISALSGDADKFRYKVGRTKVAVTNAKIRETPVPASGAMTLPLKGSAAAFDAPAAGTHAVKVPAKFTLHLYNQDGDALGNAIPCARVKGSPSKITTLTTTRDARQGMALRRS